jgi:hypothetical protein
MNRIPPDPFHTMLGRAMTDPTYRDRLLAQHDPEQQKSALREAGVEDPSDDAVNALNEAIQAFDRLGGSFGFKAFVS